MEEDNYSAEKSIDGFLYQNVWPEKNQELLDEIVAVWKETNALSQNQNPIDRAKEVVFLVRNEQNKIVAISTAFIRRIQQLRAHMFVYRCFVTKSYRRKKIATRITVITRDYLESIHKNIEPRCIGIIAETENDEFNQTMRQAVYPNY